MSSPKESSGGPATSGTPTNSQTIINTASSRTVDVAGVTCLTTPDNMRTVCVPPGSTAVESGLFEEKFDSLKSSRGDGSVAAAGNDWRTTINGATNSQVMEGGLRPASFESITEAHRSAVVLSPADKGPAEDSPPKRRRKRGGSPLAVSPDLRGTAELVGITSLLEVVPPVAKHFEVLSKIGEGTFSSVFLARLKVDGGEGVCFALKHIVPTSAPCRIENELRCLQVMGGCNHIIPLEMCIRHRDHVVFVMPYVKHDKFADYIPFMTVEETREYMKALFLALRHVHSFHVIHRDIKPGNFLYNRKEKSFYLVDFGLAHLEAGRTGEFRGPSILSTTSKNHSHGRSQPKQQPHLPEIRRSPRLAGGSKSIAFVTPQRPATPVSTQGSATQSTSNPKTSNSGSAISQSQLGCKRGSLPGNNSSGASYQRGRNVDVLTSRNKRSKAASPEGRGARDDRKGLTCSDKRVKMFVKDPLDSYAQPKQMRLSMSAGPKKATVDSLPRNKRSLSASRQRQDGCDLEHRETEVCDICMARQSQNAPRAGTPGFRAPEVLLKSPQQTIAVDMWSVGVILLCILSGRYPFFRAQDDLTAFIQIMRLMGTVACKEAAKALGKELVCKPEVPPSDLKLLCRQLRASLPNERRKLQKRARNDDEIRTSISSLTQSVCKDKEEEGTESLSPKEVSSSSGHEGLEFVSEVPNSLLNAPTSLYDLLHRLLRLDPAQRITADEALQHPFITDQ